MAHTLYARPGGAGVVSKSASHLVDHHISNPMIGKRFAGSDPVAASKKAEDSISLESRDPNTYSGLARRSANKHMKTPHTTSNNIKALAFWCFFGSLIATNAVAQQVPQTDVPGSSDSDLVGRIPGSILVNHFSTPLDQAEFPKSVLKPRGGSVGNNVYVATPDASLVVQGSRTRNVYLLAPGVQPFAAVQAYVDKLSNQGAEVVFSCRADSCGGKSDYAGDLGGNTMSLAYYLWPDDRITGNEQSAGWCAQTGKIGSQEYRLLHNEVDETTISVHSYILKPGQFSNCRKAFTDKVVLSVDIIAPKADSIDLKIVTSSEMQDQISLTGKIALYGITFDSGKDSLRADSSNAIDQIALLMKSDKTLKLLIVGHTDSAGSFEFNQDLSERRARTVVETLIGQHAIERSRLFAVGVSFASPVASNDTEDGKAKNRRVELVKF